MDEYLVKSPAGDYAFLPPDDERSYHFYMQDRILRQQRGVKSYFPSLENIDSPGSYDEIIQAHGGIDISLNAIGEDGHTFGFNMPGSSFSSKTRMVELNDDTKAVNEKLTGLATPQYAVTAGLETGMASREVLMLVSGKRKADMLKQIIHGEISDSVPATVLRKHPNCLWIVDEAAASEL